ncbi:MAG: hypothetical protein ETSY2_17500 [Candidatus Entotheonella gemina]|uniref:Uncharacterized protein n=1 Tax=Candidatus Entotheonella gemina TaxID=1429439 RepID=W4M7R4_9BACT|nr:MAG: hypothetical protein ETSY2_17500 [Candidatus Entotheonella gemina]
MAEQAHEDPIEAIRRKADDFARHQHADVFKRFEQLLKPPSKDRQDGPDSISEDS